MSDREQEVLCYLTELRSQLRMDNWDIVLKPGPPEDKDGETEDVLASTNWVLEHYTITLWLNWDRWETSTPAERVDTLVHELVHAQHRDLCVVWETAVLNNPALSVRESGSWDDQFHTQLERFVSWITDRICCDNAVPTWPGSTLEPGHGIRFEEPEDG